MRKVRCQNQHFFDADTWNACPHCGAWEESKTGSQKETGWKASQNELKKDSKSKPDDLGLSKKKIKFLWSKEKESESKTGDEVSEQTCLLGENVSKNVEFKSIESVKREIDATVLLAEDEIAEQNDNEPFNLDTVKTVSIYATDEGSEPVTGWLVAIKGMHYGRSYELKTGQNYIGRDAMMDVALTKETQVSRIKHASIIYEPKKRMFLLHNGEGSGLTYCNDELVLGHVTLKANDRIQLGDAVLLFVPLCGDDFCWDN